MTDTKKKEPQFNDVYEVLHFVQKSLHAPKSQYNSFGKYHFRNCEDIQEGLKKVLPEGAVSYCSDEIVEIAGRIYVKSTAHLCFKDKCVSNTAFAREPQEQKGMSDSQITGASSSYARKYALGGLYMVDDQKDADSQEKQADEPKKPVNQQAKQPEKPTKTWEQIRANEISLAIDKHKDINALEKMWEANAEDLDKIQSASEKARSALNAKYEAKRKELDQIPY